MRSRQAKQKTRRNIKEDKFRVRCRAERNKNDLNANFIEVITVFYMREGRLTPHYRHRIAARRATFTAGVAQPEEGMV